MHIKEILAKSKAALPNALGGVVLIAAASLMGFGLMHAVKGYLPGLMPITSGTQVAFDQQCAQKGKDKAGKETCLKKGPLTIYSLDALKAKR